MTFDAVLFDCDGVLADSEAITNGVLRDMLDEMGWRMSLPECMGLFVGKTVMSESDTIERHTGQRIDEGWLRVFRSRRDARLDAEVQAVRHVLPAVQQLHTVLRGRIACASGADHPKLVLMLRRCGLLQYFDGRLFSGQEQARNKPHPDVYLAAARALDVDPGRCAVVEDTVTGVRAGVAAGATVLGYSPPEAGHDAPAALRSAGAAKVFTDMAQLPGFILGGHIGDNA
jgi:HAD superfamily hydrolase (TIGR01509 family)